MIVAACAMPLVRIVPVVRADTKFQPVYVGDVARALVAALAAPEAFGGKTIELGGPDVLSMRALLQWIAAAIGRDPAFVDLPDRSEEHTSELQSLMRTSYAVFCLT